MNTAEQREHYERVLEKLAGPVFSAASAEDLVRLLIEELPKEKTFPEAVADMLGDTDAGKEKPELKHIRAGCLETNSAGNWGLKLKRGWLVGKRLHQFDELWGVFALKDGMRPAAQSFFNDLQHITENFAHILYAARQTVLERKPGGATPKMLQGWLSDRRYEDYDPQTAPDDHASWTDAHWQNLLTPYLKRHKSWPEYMPGPNPWGQFNPQIPETIRAEYQSWNWVDGKEK